MPLKVWVGTSGYVYPEWVGSFYPRGTTSKQMLPRYVEHFPLVELNFTFYRMPTAYDLERMVRRTPEGFHFIVKLHQSLSHDHNLDNAPPFRAAVEPLRQAGRLLAILCQFPQRYHNNQANQDQLQRLAAHFDDCPLAVEFRHRSWDRPETPSWLGSRGLHLVSVDVPDIRALYPRRLVQSSRLVYIRLHSRRAQAWYEPGADRYDYLYSDEELREWLMALASQPDTADQVLLLFNNCRRAQAAENAKRVRELIEQWGAPFHLVPTIPPSGECQQLLF